MYNPMYYSTTWLLLLGVVHLGFFELFEKYIIGNMITTKSTSFYTPHNFRVTKRSKCFQICHIFVIRKPQFHFEEHVLLWVLLFHNIFANVKLFIWSRFSSSINPENFCDIVLSMYFTQAHFFYKSQLPLYFQRTFLFLNIIMKMENHTSMFHVKMSSRLILCHQLHQKIVKKIKGCEEKYVISSK